MQAIQVFKAGLVLVAMMGVAGAHLVDGSLLPKGGEKLTINMPVKITWSIQVPHTTVDVYYSKDGGASWKVISSGPGNSTGKNTYDWPGPTEVTTKGKIRICQYQSTGCKDKDSVSRAGVSDPYVLVSGAIEVVAATSLHPSGTNNEGMFMAYRPATCNIDVSFVNGDQESVSLQAFDAQCHLVATLLDGEYAAGSHTLSLFSNRVAASAQALVFKLTVGDQVKTQIWNAVP